MATVLETRTSRVIPKKLLFLQKVSTNILWKQEKDNQYMVQNGKNNNILLIQLVTKM